MAKKLDVVFFIIVLISLTLACARAKNHEDAYRITIEGQTYIKIIGERVRMSHDPISTIFNSTYKDSILIQIPPFKEGVVQGKDILTKNGQYAYEGNIVIKGDSLKVDLLINDTDSNILKPLSWNGTYKLHRSR